jgi:hypothetical protein
MNAWDCPFIHRALPWFTTPNWHVAMGALLELLETSNPSIHLENNPSCSVPASVAYSALQGLTPLPLYIIEPLVCPQHSISCYASTCYLHLRFTPHPRFVIQVYQFGIPFSAFCSYTQDFAETLLIALCTHASDVAEVPAPSPPRTPLHVSDSPSLPGTPIPLECRVHPIPHAPFSPVFCLAGTPTFTMTAYS